MWQTVGEYFQECGMFFPIESLKLRLRQVKAPHKEGSWPYKYRKEDLDAALEYVKAHSQCLRHMMFR